MKSQNRLIAEHFAEPGATLTALEALRMFGSNRLAARVLELRRAGVAIESRLIHVTSAR